MYADAYSINLIKSRLKEKCLHFSFLCCKKRKEKQNEFKENNESAADIHNARNNAADAGIC